MHLANRQDTSDPLNPIILGISMKALSAESTNDSWTSAFIKTVDSVLHKLLILQEFCVYMTSRPVLYCKMKHDEFVQDIKTYQV
jgi:hypothetical protein